MVSRRIGWRRVSAALTVTVLSTAVRAWPQPQLAVPLTDPVYRSLDLVVAAGLVDTIVVGQRPYFRSQIWRLVDGARRNAERLDPTALDRRHRDALADLVARFSAPTDAPPPSPRAGGGSPHRRLLNHAEVALVVGDAGARAVGPDTGTGHVDALIAPLAQRTREGRDVTRGTTLALETIHDWSVGSRLVVHAHPRLTASTANAESGDRTLTLHTAGARVAFRNVVLSAGRDQFAWGQGRIGGLLLSRNARPLDMIGVRTTHPRVPPGLFGALGPSAFSLFVADLGLRQHFRHTKLIGYKWNGRLTPRLEVGLGALDFMGGSGAPGATFDKRLVNIFLFPFLHTEGYQFSNTMAAVDVRYRIPRFLRGRAEAYWEMTLDDFGRRIASSVWTDDAAQLFGLAAMGVGPEGRVDVTSEFRHTGTRFGRHQQFRSGPTVDRMLLGEPLGPAATGAYLFVDVAFFGRGLLGLELSAEEYRNDQHTLTYSPLTVHLVEQRPRERRYRALTSFRAEKTQLGGTLRLDAGVEQVDGFGFAAGRTKTNFLVGLTASHTFR